MTGDVWSRMWFLRKQLRRWSGSRALENAPLDAGQAAIKVYCCQPSQMMSNYAFCFRCERALM